MAVKVCQNARESISEAQTGDQKTDEDGDQLSDPINWLSGQHFDLDLQWLHELCNVELKAHAPSAAKKQ